MIRLSIAAGLASTHSGDSVALCRAQIGSFTDSRGLFSVAQDTELSPFLHRPGLRYWDYSRLRMLLRGTLQRFPEPNPRGTST